MNNNNKKLLALWRVLVFFDTGPTGYAPYELDFVGHGVSCIASRCAHGAICARLRKVEPLYSNHASGVYIIRFLRGYLVKSEYITNTKCCISSSRRRYTLKRDEIQGRQYDLDDIPHTPCGDDIPSLRLG